jgi:hypothetical protein
MPHPAVLFAYDAGHIFPILLRECDDKLLLLLRLTWRSPTAGACLLLLLLLL